MTRLGRARLGCGRWSAALMGSAALAMMAAGAAHAQDDDFDTLMAGMESELYCVFDVLSQSGDYHDIADVWVKPDPSDEEIDAADSSLAEAVAECAASYDWDDKAQEFASTVAIHGSVVEVLTGDMVLVDGLEEAQVEAIFDLLEDLADEDVETFRDAAWLADAKFQKRIYRALVRSGVPNEDRALEHAMYVLESSVMTAHAIVDWMELKASAPEAPKVDGTKAAKSSKSPNRPPRTPKMELVGTGTGWYVAPDGYLVTNAHVVESCKAVTLKSGVLLDLVDIETDEDLALLKGPTSAPHLSLRDGKGVRLAEDVLIAGYPLGGILSSGINVTIGTVSALAGLGDDARKFQFTAPVQPGNSGGPVLDTSGNVIGVVVSKLNAMSIQDQIGDIPQNVNFGIQLPSLTAFLKANGVAYEQRVSSARVDKVDLAELARESTVLLQCYQ